MAWLLVLQWSRWDLHYESCLDLVLGSVFANMHLGFMVASMSLIITGYLELLLYFTLTILMSNYSHSWLLKFHWLYFVRVENWGYVYVQFIIIFHFSCGFVFFFSEKFTRSREFSNLWNSFLNNRFTYLFARSREF